LLGGALYQLQVVVQEEDVDEVLVFQRCRSWVVVVARRSFRSAAGVPRRSFRSAAGVAVRRFRAARSFRSTGQVAVAAQNRLELVVAVLHKDRHIRRVHAIVRQSVVVATFFLWSERLVRLVVAVDWHKLVASMLPLDLASSERYLLALPWGSARDRLS